METSKLGSIDSTVALGDMDTSLIGLFLQADILVQSVMVMLVVASIWSWAIIFNKWAEMKALHKLTQKFEKDFWSGNSLEALHDNLKSKTKHPYALVFSSAMHEWRSRDSGEIKGNSNLRVGTKERIYQVMQISINKASCKLEKGLNFLATVGSAAPFIGLFGTVWGVMASFQSIAISKNTTLAVVAPGIAEALLATAFGLAAAIPALIFYNKFAAEINKFIGSLEDFANELGAIMSKELDNLK